MSKKVELKCFELQNSDIIINIKFEQLFYL